MYIIQVPTCGIGHSDIHYRVLGVLVNIIIYYINGEKVYYVSYETFIRQLKNMFLFRKYLIYYIHIFYKCFSMGIST